MSSTKKVIFTDVMGVSDCFIPVPATHALPDWYKNMPDYADGHRVIVDGNTPHTIKKCLPVFDAMTAGYIITTYVDVQVTHREGSPWYEWPSHNALGFHPIKQATTHPAMNGAPIPKWSNPWAIETPMGWSCMFLPPMHNPNGYFTILPGIVDTDTYTAPVNFPFTLNDVTWEGIIPAGTPMAQVIPYRRESYQMHLGTDADRHKQASATTRLKSLWLHSYKRQFWTRKHYR